MHPAAASLPDWARWNPVAAEAPWTVGLEEEIILLDPETGGPMWQAEDVLAQLPPALAENTRSEMHGCALELATSAHATVGAATAELEALRAGVADAVRALGFDIAATGTHPAAGADETQVAPGARYRRLHASLRELARGIPTFGLHVHVAVPTPAIAVRALDRIRAHLPVLLALSANSPFHDGRDTGLASARTQLFQVFPRSGLPRVFGTYDRYVAAIDSLVRSGAIPEPTFVWWDARLQPAFGTLEVRVMDAQTRVADTAALAALAHSVVRLEALEGFAADELVEAPEVLAENKFLAARDGAAAALVDPRSCTQVPLPEQVSQLLDACRPHAEALSCGDELESVRRLLTEPGAARQRAAADRGGLHEVIGMLVREFAPSPAALAAGPSQ